MPVAGHGPGSRPPVPAARRWRLVRAPSVAIPASVRRFNQRARARRIRSARPFAIVALALITLGVVAFIVYGTSVLGVDRVDVTGSGFVGDAAVRSAAGVGIGTPLASIDTGAVAARVERLPGVESARVHRDWPSRLVIDVTPRTAVAAVRSGRSYVLLDASGVGFRTVSSRPDVMLIALDTPGHGDPATRAVLSVLSALPSDLRDRVASMTAASAVDISLTLTDHKTIIWGDASNNAEKARVALSLLRRPGTVINVSAPNVVTVR